MFPASGTRLVHYGAGFGRTEKTRFTTCFVTELLDMARRLKRREFERAIRYAIFRQSLPSRA